MYLVMARYSDQLYLAMERELNRIRASVRNVLLLRRAHLDQSFLAIKSKISSTPTTSFTIVRVWK